MLALAAVAGAAGLTTYAAVVATRLGGLLAMIGVVGVAVLAAALVLRLPALVMPGLALLGAEYAGEVNQPFQNAAVHKVGPGRKPIQSRW